MTLLGPPQAGKQVVRHTLSRLGLPDFSLPVHLRSLLLQVSLTSRSQM